ncbi:hypothetical protein NG2371_01878 [Nocardia gamkensis]|nr:hypothetical protein [Nocardia gamkensis]
MTVEYGLIALCCSTVILAALVVTLDVLRYRGTLGPVDYLTYTLWCVLLGVLGAGVYGMAIGASVPLSGGQETAALITGIPFAISAQIAAARKMTRNESR